MNAGHRKFLPVITTAIVFSLLLSLASPLGWSAGAQEPPGDRRAPVPADRTSALQELWDSAAPSGLRGQGGGAEPLGKLSGALREFLAKNAHGPDVGAAAADTAVRITPDSRLLVDVYTNGSLDHAVQGLEALGMEIIATNAAFGGIVEGYLPAEMLVAASSLDSVKAILDVPAPIRNAGSALSEGDATHNGSEARALGTTGTGVVVGVISDSIDWVDGKIAGSQADGDLPATVTVLADCNLLDLLDPCQDEGRAMAEIIYDLAPGITTMKYHTGWHGAVDKAGGIGELVAAGVDVIADDITYLNEPFFQDGVVEQAVDAAYAAGVGYFAAAGNYGAQSYESDFRNAGDGYHDFAADANTNELQIVTDVGAGDQFNLTLQWDDPWGSATHDFDVYLYNEDTWVELASSEGDNVSTGLPTERLQWQNNTGGTVTVSLGIYKYAGTDTSFLKWISYGGGGDWTVQDSSATDSSTIAQDAQSAKGALAVAAVYAAFDPPDAIESYSSIGPYATKFFSTAGVRLGTPDRRIKPDVAGADGVSTSENFQGGEKFGGAFGFSGTSAAAPHMAGVAALVLGARPNIPAEQLYAILKNPHNTVDCQEAGNPDKVCGYGFVMADKAVDWARRNMEADFNDNSTTDFSLFRPSNGTWYIRNQFNAVWGATGDIPVAADYDDDGDTDVAVFRPSTNVWYVKDQFNSQWGGSGDTPVPGDYNGDGKADVAVWRPSNATWYIKGQSTSAWGQTGDIPVPADYNGDGKTDLAVFRPSTGTWYVKGYMNTTWGQSGDVPTPGDYNGDRKTDFAIFRPSTGIWYVKGQFNSAWGAAGDSPVPGDYDADGKTDVAIFRPTNGTWYVKGKFTQPWGQSGDWPIPALWTGQAAASDMYLLLTWGANPTDLDSHLWVPAGGACTSYHVYFSTKGSLAGCPWANLDLDDTTSYGPEKIRIVQFAPGTYTYAVDWWLGTGTWATSGAQVQIFKNGALVNTVTVPSSTATGNWWYVADIDGSTGAITLRNIIQDASPAGIESLEEQVPTK